MKFEVLEPSIEDAKSSDPKGSNGFQTKFEILVYVRLPDGSFLWLPVARNASEQKVAEFDSKTEAGNWAEFCLPNKVLIQER